MRTFITNEWLTIFTVLGLFAVAIAKYLHTLRFNDFLMVISNSKYLNIYSKSQKFIDPFEGFLFLNLSFSGSIFLYLTYITFVNPIAFDLIFFLKLLFAFAAILLIKTLLERLIGSLFDIDTIIDKYVFQKTTFLNYSGIVVLIANVILLYTEGFENIIIIATFCVVCLINGIGFVSSFKSSQKTLIPNLFYFLLYLCALEIAPYVLLYKVVRGYNI